MSSGFSLFSQTLFPELVRRSPPELARNLMLAASGLYFAVNAAERRAIEENVSDLLGASERACAVRRRVFGHMTEHYFEKLLVANKPIDFLRAFVRSHVECARLELLDTALAAGRGVVAVTAHWGAVELVPPALADRGYPVSIVLETATPRLRASLERLVDGIVLGADSEGASIPRAELIIASRGDRVLDRVLDALARGRILVTQVDEVDAWRRRRSRTVQLFGKTLFFDHTLDFIAKKAGAPAVGIFCKRKGNLRYGLRCEELAPDPSCADVATRALALWERYTLDAPEQWYQWPKWRAMKVEV